jgi:hypothetical protein
MDTQNLINQILKATIAEDIFTRANFKKEYLYLLKMIHPDVCSLPKAHEAVQRLIQFKSEMEAALRIEDDAGFMHILDDFTVAFSGDKVVLQKSLNNYRILMNRTDVASNHFKKYLPSEMFFENDKLIVRSNFKMTPLPILSGSAISKKTIPQHHVTWITSRLLEFISWIQQIGYCHAGINPESVAVAPDTHGIVCLSFYHLQPLGSRLQTLSGRYQNWYPSVVFDEKKAISYIDTSLVQRTAIYLLGDSSGNGIKLKRTHNEALIDFLTQPHHDTFSTYDKFRKLLRLEFGKPTFHPM